MKFDARQLNMYAWYLRMDGDLGEAVEIEKAVRDMAINKEEPLVLSVKENPYFILKLAAVETVYKIRNRLDEEAFLMAKDLYTNYIKQKGL